MNTIILQSTITCPYCHYRSKEKMSTESCRSFWKCLNCHKQLKPKPGEPHTYPDIFFTDQ